MMTVTARAHPNIAFIKYWGNRNAQLRLPSNSSLSMTLDGLYTETTVRWDHQLSSDVLVLNHQEQAGEPLSRVSAHLDALRNRFGTTERAVVETYNNFPTGAGIASSASAFAALTVAGVAALNQTISERELSTLARLGSGSASRSISAGFVEWHAADTHEESYAETVFPADHWELVDVVVIVSRTHKITGSTAGHGSASTSDLQNARIAGAQDRLRMLKAAIAARDFASFAEIVEHDSNLMHAVMMTSRPPLFYWMPASLAIMDAVRQLRAEGLRVCYTLDAGPNVHCICVREDSEKVREAISRLSMGVDIVSAGVGQGAQVIQRA